MEQTLFEQNGRTYAKQGDYLLPDVKLPDQLEYEIGIWGNHRRQYLKQHHKVKYYNMFTQCTSIHILPMWNIELSECLMNWLKKWQNRREFQKNES